MLCGAGFFGSIRCRGWRAELFFGIRLHLFLRMYQTALSASFPFRMAAAVVQAPQSEGNSEASAVRALVDCIKKEETVVTVNLDERIQVSLTVR